MSYWESPDAEITAAKRDELKSIARRARPDIDEEALNDLLMRTAFAIENLCAMREQKRQTQMLEKLEKLREAAVPFLRAWGDVQSDHHLLRIMDLLFQGRLGHQPHPPAETPEQVKNRVAEMMRRRDRMTQIEAALSEDLPQLLAELGSMIDALRKVRRHRNPMEYFCVYKIANAWLENVHTVPTLSRNTDAVSGPQKSDFESYVASAVPRGPIGPGILRSVVDSLRSELD